MNVTSESYCSRPNVSTLRVKFHNISHLKLQQTLRSGVFTTIFIYTPSTLGLHSVYTRSTLVSSPPSSSTLRLHSVYTRSTLGLHSVYTRSTLVSSPPSSSTLGLQSVYTPSTLRLHSVYSSVFTDLHDLQLQHTLELET